MSVQVARVIAMHLGLRRNGQCTADFCKAVLAEAKRRAADPTWAAEHHDIARWAHFHRDFDPQDYSVRARGVKEDEAEEHYLDRSVPYLLSQVVSAMRANLHFETWVPPRRHQEREDKP